MLIPRTIWSNYLLFVVNFCPLQCLPSFDVGCPSIFRHKFFHLLHLWNITAKLKQSRVWWSLCYPISKLCLTTNQYGRRYWNISLTNNYSVFYTDMSSNWNCNCMTKKHIFRIFKMICFVQPIWNIALCW